jgi:hypothetical protein
MRNIRLVLYNLCRRRSNVPIILNCRISMQCSKRFFFQVWHICLVLQSTQNLLDMTWNQLLLFTWGWVWTDELGERKHRNCTPNHQLLSSTCVDCNFFSLIHLCFNMNLHWHLFCNANIVTIWYCYLLKEDLKIEWVNMFESWKNRHRTTSVYTKMYLY